MTIQLFQDPFLLPVLAAGFIAGIAMGMVYFLMLRRSTDLLAAGGGMINALLLTLGRMALMGGGLVMAALQGAGPLLATALGIWIGRAIAMRRVASRKQAEGQS